jgi:DNA-binding MarR family transcriptional regulator
MVGTGPFRACLPPGFDLTDLLSHDREDTRAVRTVNLSADDIAAVARILSALIAKPGADVLPSFQMIPEEPAFGVAPAVNATQLDRDALRRCAAETLRLRKRRQLRFSASMFGEPAWELLLILYANDGVRFTIKHLSDRAGLPPTTALRWIDVLVQQGFISRESHPTDMRKVMVELAEPGRSALDMYFSETLTPTA